MSQRPTAWPETVRALVVHSAQWTPVMQAQMNQAANQTQRDALLRRYGYGDDADRLSGKFLTMVLENFRRDRTMREKYNVVTRDSRINAQQGYHQNVIGFSWTNATFSILADQLSPATAQKLKSH